MKRMSGRQSTLAAKAAVVGSLAVAGCLAALPATAQDLSAQGLLVQGPVAGTEFVYPGMSITTGGGYRVGFGGDHLGGGFGGSQFGGSQFGGGFGGSQFGGKPIAAIPDDTTIFDMPDHYFDEHRSISPQLQSPAPGGPGSGVNGHGSRPGGKSGVTIPDNTTTFDMPNPYFDEHRSISPRPQSPVPGGSGSPDEGLEAPEIIPL